MPTWVMKNYSANWPRKPQSPVCLLSSGDTPFPAAAPAGTAVAVPTLLALQQEPSLQDFRQNTSPL